MLVLLLSLRRIIIIIIWWGGAQYAYLVEARGGVRRALVERPALVRHAVLVDAEGEVDLVVAEGVHHLRVDREQALLCATERKRKGKERKGNVIDDERKGWLKMVKMEWRWKGKEGK